MPEHAIRFFIEYDCRDNPESQKREVAHMLNFYDEGIWKESGASYFGLVSPKFTDKTGIGGKAFIEWIEANPGYDVYFINPFPQLAYWHYNVWESGEFWHPGLRDLADILFERFGLTIRVEDLPRNTASSLLYCNFWVGNEKFWRIYMDFVRKLIDIVDHLDAESYKKFFERAPHYAPATYFPFIFERLFSIFLALHGEISCLPYPYGPDEILNKCENEMERFIIREWAGLIDVWDKSGRNDAEYRKVFDNLQSMLRIYSLCKMNSGEGMTKHKLSVLLVTFNHEKYIRQALHSIFSQNFNGEVELIIADDCSSDRTMDIIRGYDGKDDRFLFRYLNSTSNLGVTKNYQRGFAECSGEYVAVLEGDDYWISPTKLQRQADFLDAHGECDLCSVNYFVYEEDKAQFTARTTTGRSHKLMDARALIADNLVGNFSTCMYRRAALNQLPRKLFEIQSYDWIVNICVASRSLIGFLEEPMSVYRLHSNGVWSQNTPIEKLESQLAILPAYDALTQGVFHDDFTALAGRLRQARNMTKMGNAVKGLAARSLPSSNDDIPPVIIKVARMVMPSALKRLIARIRAGHKSA